MAIAHVATVTSENANTTNNTSLSVSRAGTAAGQLEVIEISGLATGTTVNPTMSTPSGWTKLGERLDTNGTPASFVAVYYRIRQSGDGSSTSITWSNQGQMIAVASAYSGVDQSTPIDDEIFWFKVDSNASYSITVTATGSGWLRYGFANRTGTAWSAMTDTERGQVTLVSSSTMVSRDTNGNVTSGGYTKNATGSNTSVGVGWGYRILEGTVSQDESGTGTAAVTAAATSTGAGGIVSSGSDFALLEGATGQMNATSLEPDNSTPKAGTWVHVSGDFNLVDLMSDPTDPQAEFVAPEV